MTIPARRCINLKGGVYRPASQGERGRRAGEKRVKGADMDKVGGEKDEKAAGDGDEANRLSNHASAFMARGSAETAGAFSDEALAREPASVRANVCKALALVQAGDYKRGLEYAEKALALAPDCGTAYVARGYARGKAGDLEAAAADFARGSDLYPRDYRVFYNVACFWAERGDEEKCRAYLRRAFELAPNVVADTAPRDPCFKAVRTQPWFREIVGEP